MGVTDPDALIAWERAEVVRSQFQATRTPVTVRPTKPSTIRRYDNPLASTPYPLEYLYHLVGDVYGRIVLDFGAGDGRDTALLARRGAHVCALDISPDLLAIAEQRVVADGQSHAVTLLCGSAHAVPLPDDSVDLVFGNAVLHHLDLERCAGEVYRVLKPGGRAIFKEPVRDSRVLRALRPLVPYRQPDLSPFERPLLWREVEAFASRFEMLSCRCFNLPFVTVARLLRAPSPQQDRLQRADAWLLRRWPRLRCYASVVVFELRKR